MLISTKTYALMLLAIGLFATAMLSAQHPFLSELKATAAPDGMHIDWTMRAGRTCHGIDIERRIDDGLFQVIGSIEGVCGDIVSPVDFSFVDISPVGAHHNEYRLRVGFDGYTEPVSEYYIDYRGRDFRVLQQMGASRLTVFSAGARLQTTIMDVLTSEGRVVDSVVLESEGGMDYDLGHLRPGVYFIRIQEQGRVLFYHRFVYFL